MLLGNVAIRLGQPIDYDGTQGKVTNVAAAAALVDPAVRKGWEL